MDLFRGGRKSMKSSLFMGVALSLGALALSACGSGSEPAADAAPEGFPGIEVSNARLVLPAVKGNPGAAYFDVDYDGDRAAMIRAASVAGAQSTTIHSTVENPDGTTTMAELAQVPVKKGTKLTFEPGANHVMATGLPDTLKAGDSIEITITFVGGDKTSFPAEVRAAGEAD